MARVDTARLTICLSHADPGAVPGSAPFAAGSPVLHDAWDTARHLVRDFNPEIVVFFGTDHRRTFRQVIPTVAVALAASARGDRGGPTGEYRVPSDLSRIVAAGLLEREVDAAIAYHPHLDHAFGLTARDLLGGLSTYPIMPVFLNTASPPLPTLRRAAAIGRAVHEVLVGRCARVLYLGSGGLTHDLPGFYPLDDGIDWSEEERLERNARLNAELKIPGLTFSSEWDRELLAGLAGTDDAWLDSVGRDIAQRGGNGANEAITWVAAWAAGGEPLATLAYEFDDAHSISTAVTASVSALASPSRD
jgi:2,3-dihydroxyphenylpropionate 1,2-dioxygenase